MRALAPLALALTLLAAGCGGGSGATSGEPLSREEYQERVSELAREAGERLAESADVSDGISASDVRRSAAELRALAEKLQKIVPPSDARHAHRELVQGLRDFSIEFPNAMEEIGYSTDQAEVLARLAKLLSFQLLQHAQLEFARRGYTIELA